MTENVDWTSAQPGGLTSAAIAMHEIFTSLLGAGFTEQQALYLTAQLTVGGRRRDET